MSVAPLLTVVIPALNEAPHLPALLDDLRGLSVRREVIVADGGSEDATREIAAAGGARVVSGEAGRGVQLRAGALAAHGAVLAFLHADVRLGSAAIRRLDLIAGEPGEAAAAFRLRIDTPRPVYRVLERGTNLRSRLLRLPYGDQGLIVRREVYWAAGGHPPVPLMEDVMLARALARSVGIELLPESIRVSARRWERDGPLRRTAINLSLLLRFQLGASPAELAEAYRRPARNR